MIDSLKMRFGLLGRNISYSFSKGHFTDKFKDPVFEGYTYENFDIEDINYFTELIKNNPDLRGLNVTIPYKEAILPFLDKLSKKATAIGAVNTIKFTKKGKLKGYNTDYYGFKKSLEPLLQPHHTKALILGTGGVAANSSCSVVLPSATRKLPAKRRGRMPSCMAWARSASISGLVPTRALNCSLSVSNS